MASAAPAAGQSAEPLHGIRLVIACITLAVTNFMVVLDTTIANVSVPHIAGGLGISASQGTWVITSYAVAEAVCVPLTGWLAQRFGAVRTFAFGMVGFGLFSFLCGVSTTLTMLVACRVGQGLCGGPLMPLSQTLLLRIFPKEQHAQAMGIWAMTTVVAPILGPILGGTISDNWSWHWIFFINIPVALGCAAGAMLVVRVVETPIRRVPIDMIGLALLVLWIGALQIMLDLGREHDWFSDSFIVALAIIAAVGFVAFLIWELTEANPVVDLRVFRHRGFSAAVVTTAFAFGTFFSTIVVIPQWLQVGLGYTATKAGYVMAFMGVAAVVMSPIVAKLISKIDPRALVCFGVAWLGMTSLLRAGWSTEADFWTLAIPQMVQGFGMPFFFVAVTTLALGAVRPEETASAAGLLSFLRTMSGAVGTSIVATAWDDKTRVARSEIVSSLNTQSVSDALSAQGFSLDQVRVLIERSVEQQAQALATTQVFLVASAMFAFAAAIIWLSPRPRKDVDTSAAH
ncbi:MULTISPECIES: DHA2 family efflux MFS transporter permease subunit [Sphingomonas]|uniref:MFS transporter n=1 Tax=Edaphosphingomonas fennica TaxID=114404 RepID=A0A2T4I4B0_9SPHN|nr:MULTISPECIES: DHA2 family efflux MFS transporter permease subunit [Sphingomonas]AGH50546.1 multidrug resistance protein B [Sphingomonas sp. MM-1]PTD24251.1 MFS transporter [Sphingomonas fennica]